MDESPENPEFFNHGRHVFIMTTAGRPIFVRYGDEIKVVIIYLYLFSHQYL